VRLLVLPSAWQHVLNCHALTVAISALYVILDPWLLALPSDSCRMALIIPMIIQTILLDPSGPTR